MFIGKSEATAHATESSDGVAFPDPPASRVEAMPRQVGTLAIRLVRHVRALLSTLRARALVLVLLAVVPAWALTVYTSAEWRNQDAADRQEDLLQFAQLVSAHGHWLVE